MKNLVKLIILVILCLFILKDLLMLFTFNYSFTYFGFITFIFNIMFASLIYDDLEEQLKKCANKGTVKHTSK